MTRPGRARLPHSLRQGLERRRRAAIHAPANTLDSPSRPMAARFPALYNKLPPRRFLVVLWGMRMEVSFRLLLRQERRDREA